MYVIKQIPINKSIINSLSGTELIMCGKVFLEALVILYDHNFHIII